jgi:hypothetical protein
MRIYFNTLSRADRYLSCCKSTLLDYVPDIPKVNFPSARVRNAFCFGLGYTSYDDLRTTVLQNLAAAKDIPTVDSVREAAIVGFNKALQVIDHGTEGASPSRSPQLPTQLAEVVINFLSQRGDLRGFDSPSNPAEDLLTCNRCGEGTPNAPLAFTLMPAKVFPFRYEPAGELGTLCRRCLRLLVTELVRIKAKTSQPNEKFNREMQEIEALLAVHQPINLKACSIDPPQFTPGELDDVYLLGSAWGDIRDDSGQGPAIKLAEGIVWMHGIRHGGIRMNVDAATKMFDAEILRQIFAGRDAHYYWFVDDDDENLVYRADPEAKRHVDRHYVRAMCAGGPVPLYEEALILERLMFISRTDEQIREDYEKYWAEWHARHDQRPADSDLPGWGPRPFPRTIDDIVGRAATDVFDFHQIVEQDLTADVRGYYESLLKDSVSNFEMGITVITTDEPFGAAFKIVPCQWLLDETLKSIAQPKSLAAFHTFGKGFAENFDGVPVALQIECDASQAFCEPSPHPPNTILVIGHAMDGRTSIGQISYKTVDGFIRPSGEPKLSTGEKLPWVEEAAMNFMRGWLELTGQRATMAAVAP